MMTMRPGGIDTFGILQGDAQGGFGHVVPSYPTRCPGRLCLPRGGSPQRFLALAHRAMAACRRNTDYSGCHCDRVLLPHRRGERQRIAMEFWAGIVELPVA